MEDETSKRHIREEQECIQDKKNKTRAGNWEDEAGITIQIQNKSQGWKNQTSEREYSKAGNY